jgi:hypothetical protein
MFFIVPALLLAASYSLCVFVLWSGWHIFLPASITPFVPLHGVAVLYFGAGRLLYFAAPFLVGWTIAWIAVRQRLSTFGPWIGLVLAACIGATGHIHTVSVSGQSGEVSMELAYGASRMMHGIAVLLTTATPWLLWRMNRSLRGA